MTYNVKLLDYIDRVSRVCFSDSAGEMNTALRDFVRVVDSKMPFNGLPSHNQIARVKPVIRIAGMYSASTDKDHTGAKAVKDIARVIRLTEEAILRPKFFDIYESVLDYSEGHGEGLPILGVDYSISQRVYLRSLVKHALIDFSKKKILDVDLAVLENLHRIDAGTRERKVIDSKLSES